MGRPETHRTGLTDPQFQVERVPLVDGGYDYQGAYWGSPDNLWVADFTTPRTGTVIVHYFLRAPSRAEAMLMVRRDYPSAKFDPETGSIIEQTIAFLQNYLDQRDAMGDEEGDDDETDAHIEALQEELNTIREPK